MPARIILKLHISLDAYACTPAGDTDWLFPHMDASVIEWETERLWQAGIHVMGRTLYEIMAAYWPASIEPPAAPMNAIPKVVFSRTLKQARWGDTRIATGDLPAELSRMRQATDKDILVHGGVAFARAVSRLGLVDEYRFLVHPVALGSGKACFDSRADLRLVSSHAFPSGVVALTYARVP